jgi:hypothetical protein
MKEYAPFFEWFDKGQKELGVVEELFESLNATKRTHLHMPRLYRPDPPDCVCENALGERVAIEVSEVVCERAAELTAQGHAVYRRWNHGELATHIARLLCAKDAKTFNGGPYAEIVTCLFTDEPAISSEYASSQLKGPQFGAFKQLTSGFLLLSYDPATKSYPVVPLRFAT